MRKWNRDRKDLARQSAMTKHSGSASKVSVFLPSSQQLCVKDALDRGTIDTNTFIIAIEKEKDVIPVLREGMAKLGFEEGNNLYIHEGPSHTCNVEKILDGRLIDYAFLDFCGEASAHTVAWVIYMMQFVAVGSDIHITHSFRGRVNQLLKEYDGDPCPTLAKIISSNDNCSLPKSTKEETSIWLFWMAVNAKHNVNIDAHLRYKDGTTRTPMCLTSFNIISERKAKKRGLDGLLNTLRGEFKLDPYTMLIPKKVGRKPKITTDKEQKPKKIKTPRPEAYKHLSPAQWAWCEANPNSIRNRKKAA